MTRSGIERVQRGDIVRTFAKQTETGLCVQVSNEGHMRNHNCRTPLHKQ